MPSNVAPGSSWWRRAVISSQLWLAADEKWLSSSLTLGLGQAGTCLQMTLGQPSSLGSQCCNDAEMHSGGQQSKYVWQLSHFKIMEMKIFLTWSFKYFVLLLAGFSQSLNAMPLHVCIVLVYILSYFNKVWNTFFFSRSFDWIHTFIITQCWIISVMLLMLQIAVMKFSRSL